MFPLSKPHRHSILKTIRAFFSRRPLWHPDSTKLKGVRLVAETVKELTVRLPESLIEDLGGAQRAAEEVTRAAVLDLVRNGKISAGKGAEFLGMTRHDFLDLMDAHDVPVIDYPPESFACELEGLRKLLEKSARP